MMTEVASPGQAVFFGFFCWKTHAAQGPPGLHCKAISFPICSSQASTTSLGSSSREARASTSSASGEYRASRQIVLSWNGCEDPIYGVIDAILIPRFKGVKPLDWVHRSDQRHSGEIGRDRFLALSAMAVFIFLRRKYTVSTAIPAASAISQIGGSKYENRMKKHNWQSSGNVDNHVLMSLRSSLASSSHPPPGAAYPGDHHRSGRQYVPLCGTSPSRSETQRRGPNGRTTSVWDSPATLPPCPDCTTSGACSELRLLDLAATGLGVGSRLFFRSPVSFYRATLAIPGQASGSIRPLARFAWRKRRTLLHNRNATLTIARSWPYVLR